MTVGLNRAKMTTSTTGTGTITLGSAVTGYATLAEAGAVNAATYTYCIEDGNDFEIGTGTYTSSGTTLSRDTVTLSKISGTAGTSKISLSGSATVFITIKAADVQPSSAIGRILLNSGTVSSAATLDIVLTSYTAYRRVILVLDSWVPATDDVQLLLRFSTDGGSSYNSGASDYMYIGTSANANGTVTNWNSVAASSISLVNTTAGRKISSDAGGSANFEITIPNRLTALKTQAYWIGSYNDTQPWPDYTYGCGHRSTAQDTDAIRLLMSSGNISSGNWALYGEI